MTISHASSSFVTITTEFAIPRHTLSASLYDKPNTLTQHPYAVWMADPHLSYNTPATSE